MANYSEMRRPMLNRLSRGVQHLTNVITAAIMPEQRHQLQFFLRLLRQSRRILNQGGLPGLMRFLDEQALTHKFAGESALRLADALSALYPIRPFRYCIKRSILRYVILRSREEAACFMIGVSRLDRNALEGHAWIMFNGTAFQEDDDQHQRMTVIFRHPDGQLCR